MRLDLARAGTEIPARLCLLREERVPPWLPHGTYEHEGSQRVSRGSVAVAPRTRWLSTLEVPVEGGLPALLTIRREASSGSIAPDEACLVLPLGEADALLELLRGIIAQARADGVLGGAASDEAGRG
jgi:hypothetical protein